LEMEIRLFYSVPLDIPIRLHHPRGLVTVKVDGADPQWPAVSESAPRLVRPPGFNI